MKGLPRTLTDRKREDKGKKTMGEKKPKEGKAEEKEKGKEKEAKTNVNFSS